MSSSLASFAPPSTMTSALRLPATTTSRSLSSTMSGDGLMTSSPSTRATRTAAMGPRNGISEIVNAVDAPTKPGMSGEMSPSTESTVAMIWVSSRYASGKSGRIARSMKRDARTSRSESRPSRLKKPPGILPAADVFSTKSTTRGKKSMPGRGLSRAAVTRTTVSP